MAIRDPNEMNMERRLLLAMVLSMAVLFLASYFFQPAGTGIQPGQTTVIEAEGVTQREAEVVPLPDPEGTETPSTSAAQRIIEMENDQLVLRWSSAGGVLVSAQLKEYISEEGTPLEILPQGLTEAQSQTFGVRVGDPELDSKLAVAVYEVEGRAGARRLAPAELNLVYRDDELEVRRSVRLPETGYLLEMTTEVRSRNRSIPFSVLVGPGIGQLPTDPQGDFGAPSAAYYLDGSVERVDADDVVDSPIGFAPGARWVAMDSKYFAFGVLNARGMGSGRIAPGMDPAAVPTEEAASLMMAEANLEQGTEYSIFIGP
ncbi:MAG: membrane protein insertase YidC, partial [Acidobacteriota bacterium]